MASYAGPGAVATAVAAVEIAAGLWSRALALATVTPQTARTRAITPAILELAGRSLARRGQVVFDLEVDAGGALALIPCAAATVLLGSPDPASWIYSLQCYGPSSTVTRYRPRDGVVHLQYGREATRPWQGRAPWQTAQLTGALLAGVERQLSGEAESASGYVLAVPDVGDKGQAADADGEDDPLTALRRDLAAARGRTLLAPSMAAGFGGGPGVSPTTSHEYLARRFGINAPLSTIELRRDVERSILSCYGILPSLFYERGGRHRAQRSRSTNARQLRRADRAAGRRAAVRGVGRSNHANPPQTDRHSHIGARGRLTCDGWRRRDRGAGAGRDLAMTHAGRLDAIGTTQRARKFAELGGRVPESSVRFVQRVLLARQFVHRLATRHAAAIEGAAAQVRASGGGRTVQALRRSRNRNRVQHKPPESPEGLS